MSYRNTAPQRPSAGKPKSGLNSKAPLIIAITVVAVLIAAFVGYRTLTASGGYDAGGDKAAIERASADQTGVGQPPPRGAMVGNQPPQAGLPLPGNKGGR